MKFRFIIYYLFCTFEIAGMDCVNYIYDKGYIDDCLIYPFGVIFLAIILFSFLFFILPHFFISILVLIPGLFYWPWFEKIWISWFIGIAQSSDLIVPN